MNRYRYVNKKGERIEGDNPVPLTSKEEIQEVVKEELSKWVEDVEDEEGDFTACPNCNIPYFFKSGSGECVVCGAECKNGEWFYDVEKSHKKVKKEKVDVYEKVEVDDGGFGIFGDVEILDVVTIGIKDCPLCKKPVNWNMVKYRQGYLFVAKECPKCGEEAYALDEDKKVWLRRNLELEEEFFGLEKHFGNPEKKEEPKEDIDILDDIL